MGCGDWVDGHFEGEKIRTWGGTDHVSAQFFSMLENHLKEPYNWGAEPWEEIDAIEM